MEVLTKLAEVAGSKHNTIKADVDDVKTFVDADVYTADSDGEININIEAPADFAGTTASTFYDSRWTPEKAFNGTSASYNAWLGTSPTSWIKWNYTGAMTIATYKLVVTDIHWGIKTWTLEGSNTGLFTGEQTILDSQSGVTWVSGVYQTFNIANPSSFQYYRINVTESAGVYSEIGNIVIEPISATIVTQEANQPNWGKYQVSTTGFDSATDKVFVNGVEQVVESSIVPDPIVYDYTSNDTGDRNIGTRVLLVPGNPGKYGNSSMENRVYEKIGTNKT